MQRTTHHCSSARDDKCGRSQARRRCEALGGRRGKALADVRLMFQHLQDMSFRNVDITNLGGLTNMTKHEAAEMMLRVKSDADRAAGEPILPEAGSTAETLPQHTRSKPVRRCPVIPVGARMEAKFEGEGLWYTGCVGLGHGSVLDQEVSYDIVFDDNDTADFVRREHVLVAQVLWNVL